jgi:hypothetical protein
VLKELFILDGAWAAYGVCARWLVSDDLATHRVGAIVRVQRCPMTSRPLWTDKCSRTLSPATRFLRNHSRCPGDVRPSEIYEVKRHSIERHPLFYITSSINPYSPLTDIVFKHIFYVNETIPAPIHDCDAAILSG